jgi:hypothetical protein
MYEYITVLPGAMEPQFRNRFTEKPLILTALELVYAYYFQPQHALDVQILLKIILISSHVIVL